MKPTTPARIYKTKLRAGCGVRKGGKKEKSWWKKIFLSPHWTPLRNVLQEEDAALTDLEGDEYCAGTDGESYHSHEGTHDQVWMKDFFLQWDQKKIKAIITDTVT